MCISLVGNLQLQQRGNSFGTDDDDDDDDDDNNDKDEDNDEDDEDDEDDDNDDGRHTLNLYRVQTCSFDQIEEEKRK